MHTRSTRRPGCVGAAASVSGRRADTADAWRRVVPDCRRRRSGAPMRGAHHARSQLARVAPLVALCLEACSVLEPRVGARARPAHASPTADRLWIAPPVRAGRLCASGSAWRSSSGSALGVPLYHVPTCPLSGCPILAACRAGASVRPLRAAKSAGAGPIPPFRRMGELQSSGCGRGRVCGHVVVLSCARRECGLL